MANPEHLAILEKGAEYWNTWRARNPEIETVDLSYWQFQGLDLAGANLGGAYLYRSDLTNIDLGHANLRLADLMTATLNGAELTGADLSGSRLDHASFDSANLERANFGHTTLARGKLLGASLLGANFSDADLYTTDFARANLAGANFHKAKLNGTIFADVDLSSVDGLLYAIHNGPSTIGIDTLYRSTGKIPDVFLRGAGVPESLITYSKSLVGSAVEHYSLFISYSNADQDFAERLHADLQFKGIRCWFAPHHIQGGKKIHEQIDEAIRLHDKLLLILSPNSMESEWVQTEISKARKREIRDKARVLFPVRLVPFEVLRDWECFDADTGKDSAREIREYFIPDFSNWKDHDSYRKALDQLVRGLQANQPQTDEGE